MSMAASPEYIRVVARPDERSSSRPGGPSVRVVMLAVPMGPAEQSSRKSGSHSVSSSSHWPGRGAASHTRMLLSDGPLAALSLLPCQRKPDLPRNTAPSHLSRRAHHPPQLPTGSTASQTASSFLATMRSSSNTRSSASPPIRMLSSVVANSSNLTATIFRASTSSESSRCFPNFWRVVKLLRICVPGPPVLCQCSYSRALVGWPGVTPQTHRRRAGLKTSTAWRP